MSRWCVLSSLCLASLLCCLLCMPCTVATHTQHSTCGQRIMALPPALGSPCYPLARVPSLGSCCVFGWSCPCFMAHAMLTLPPGMLLSHVCAFPLPSHSALAVCWVAHVPCWLLHAGRCPLAIACAFRMCSWCRSGLPHACLTSCACGSDPALYMLVPRLVPWLLACLM
jgi:hypothetical protein